MSSILIVTDQPKYGNSSGIIATPSLSVRSIFAGDIVSNNLDAMSNIRGQRFDTLLIPATITEKSSDYEPLRKFYGYISGQNPDLKIHRYENKY